MADTVEDISLDNLSVSNTADDNTEEEVTSFVTLEPETSDATSDSVVVESVSDTLNETPIEKKGGLLWLWILLGILALFAIIGGIYKYKHR